MNSAAEVRNQDLPKAHNELPKITFQAGMSMKTKDTVSRPVQKRPRALRRDSDSWLFTSDSCTSRNEGASGDLAENTRPGTRDTKIRDTGHACAGDGTSWEHAEKKERQNPIANHKSLFANVLAPYS